jgi:flagellar hook-length control protein FliK
MPTTAMPLAVPTAADAPATPGAAAAVPTTPEAASTQALPAGSVATVVTPGGAATGVGPPESPTPPLPLDRAVVDQIATQLRPVSLEVGARSALSIDLHPAELGHLRVELSLEDGVLRVALRPDSSATGDLLRRVLPELHAALEDAGLGATDVEVGPDHRPDPRPDPRPDTRPEDRGADHPGVTPATGTGAAPTPTEAARPKHAGLDLLL